MTARFAGQRDEHDAVLAPVLDRYRPTSDADVEQLHTDPLHANRAGPIGLLRDLQELYQFASLVEITWTLFGRPRMARATWN